MSSKHDAPVAGSVEGIDERTFRLVGAVHLGLASAVNLAAGAALVYLGSTDRLVRLAFAELDAYATEVALVREASTVVSAATTGAVLLGLVFLLVGASGALVAWRAFQDRGRRWWMPGCIASALNPLATPLAFVAGALLWFGRTPENR